VPGEAFFHDDAGEGMVRLCYAKPEKDLDDACRRLEAYAKGLGF
jgi:aminotransferase